ncbi:MAG: aminotransferase class IV, partial [Arenicellales bacterium]|nr:aminotransferase class IV [Arenicellales bacterium]
TVFKLTEHVERLFESLTYLRIDINLSPSEVVEISNEVLSRNRHLLNAGDDYWLGQRISRGVKAVGDEGWDDTGPTIIVECQPLPFQERAHYYRDGLNVIIPSVRRTPPEMLSPRTKTHNYLNLVMADLEVQAQDPGAWAILLDHNGNLCEGLGSNLFLVKNGRLLTPRAQYVLAGISRGTVIDLAEQLGIACEERDLDLYDAYTADEIFVTSTSFCICPVRSINGNKAAQDAIPGEITQQLLSAYSTLVDCDIVAQYLRHLKPE